jgi:hypothetical protein
VPGRHALFPVHDPDRRHLERHPVTSPWEISARPQRHPLLSNVTLQRHPLLSNVTLERHPWLSNVTLQRHPWLSNVTLRRCPFDGSHCPQQIATMAAPGGTAIVVELLMKLRVSDPHVP